MLKNFWTKGNKENKLWYLGQKKNYTTTRHNTTQHNTTQHNTTQHNTLGTGIDETDLIPSGQYNRVIQHNTTQHNTTQHNTTLNLR